MLRFISHIIQRSIIFIVTATHDVFTETLVVSFTLKMYLNKPPQSVLSTFLSFVINAKAPFDL